MAHVSRGLFIAGNWKMFKTNTEARQFVLQLVQDLPSHSKVQAVIAAGFTLLAGLQQAAQQTGLHLQVAAQNMEAQNEGAYTGEVSPVQLKDLNIGMVVLGHSERRAYYNESDTTINLKTKSALSHGILPIVCVGETLEERNAGVTDDIVKTQVLAGLKGLTPEQVGTLVIAYEPVWAIGTGKVCDATEANRVCAWIRQVIASEYGSSSAEAVRILYGGSMKPDNAETLLSGCDIDGGLIGGASLEADSYRQLLRIATETMNRLQPSACRL